MFEGFKSIIGEAALDIDTSGKPTSRDLKIAVLVLLYSLSEADGSVESEEIGALCTSMFRQANLEDHETGELLEVAKFLVADKPKLDSFISLIANNFNADQKQILMSVLWRVILADKNIAKLESSLAAEIRSKLGLTMEQAVRSRKLAELEQINVLFEQFCQEQ